MKLLSWLLLLLLCIPVSVIPVSAEVSQSVVINEVQTGGYDELLHENGRMEFVELFNNSTDEIDLTGWKLQYFATTRDDVFDFNASPTRELGTIDGVVSGRGYVLFSYVDFIANADMYFGQGSTATTGLLARSGGHVRLISTTAILDVVAWGSARSPETKAVSEIAPGSSVERVQKELLAQDTDNNYADFQVLSEPTPSGGSLVIPDPPDYEEEEIIENDIPICDGLIITELLPNPNGVDTGKEFIEIYNPTDNDVYLQDCYLTVAPSGKKYAFPADAVIRVKEYQAFYDNVTKLTLPNSAGGEVILVGSNSEYFVEYPGNLGPDHSWVLIDGAWHETTILTPGAENALPDVSAEVLGEVDGLPSCGPGKYRHPETRRCRNIQANTASLAPCEPGKVRNPETNRCRSVVALVNSLMPCREGQERNPETNRCRNITTAKVTQCQEGYERNPETNRCRKIPVALAASPSVGSLDAQSAGRINYVFMTLMSIVVLGYGVFEYRRDLANLAHKFKASRARKLAVKQH